METVKRKSPNRVYAALYAFMNHPVVVIAFLAIVVYLLYTSLQS